MAFFSHLSKFLTFSRRPIITPTVLQMEAVECGAAALGIILGYHGKRVPLEELREQCGVSRDGSKASNVVKAARNYGLSAKGLRKETDDLKEMQGPYIVFWNFSHFLVVEGYRNGRFYLNDPAGGPIDISYDDFDSSFTGVVLVFEPTETFEKGGEKESVVASLAERLKNYGDALSLVLLFSLFLILPGLIVPLFLRFFIDSVLLQQQIDWIPVIAGGLLLAILLNAIWSRMQQYYLLKIETKLAVTSSARFFSHVLKLPINFFIQRFSGDIAMRVKINDNIALLLSRELATNMLSIVMLIFYIAVMLTINVTLTLIGVVIALINLYSLWAISKKRVDANRKLQQDMGRMIGFSMAGIQMMDTIKSTGGEVDFFSQWAGYFTKVVNTQQKFGFQTAVLSVVPAFLAVINTAIVLIIGSTLVIDQEMTLGGLIAFNALLMAFSAPINQLVNLAMRLQDIEAGIKRLDDVHKYEVDKGFQSKESDTPQARLKLSGNLEIRGLTFGYSPLSSPLIEDFNLALQPGARVALVGPTGCGKSTISKLVNGLYQPWRGEILLDGKPKDTIDRDVLSNSMAMVDQDIFLFEGTVRENLTLWNKAIPESDIIRAAKDACIHEQITQRNGGYDSIVEEAGRNFSGGERQRLEIARALVLKPKIIILDEATSALDAKTQMIIDQNLRRRGCTCLIIAHRLSTIRDCDEIIVLDRGEVIERGTHTELIEKEGFYSNLIKN